MEEIENTWLFRFCPLDGDHPLKVLHRLELRQTVKDEVLDQIISLKNREAAVVAYLSARALAAEERARQAEVEVLRLRGGCVLDIDALEAKSYLSLEDKRKLQKVVACTVRMSPGQTISGSFFKKFVTSHSCLYGALGCPGGKSFGGAL